MARMRKALLLAVFFIVMTVASTRFFGYTTGRTIEEDIVLPADGKLHVLLVGEDEGLIAPGQKVRGRSDTIMAVSYTHLDVYKRQLLYWILIKLKYILG